jgi:hypothetical protein
VDKIAEIERLKVLRDSGALTEDEFATEKSRLLRAPRRNAMLVMSGILVLVLDVHPRILFDEVSAGVGKV